MLILRLVNNLGVREAGSLHGHLAGEDAHGAVNDSEVLDGVGAALVVGVEHAGLVFDGRVVRHVH